MLAILWLEHSLELWGAGYKTEWPSEPHLIYMSWYHNPQGKQSHFSSEDLSQRTLQLKLSIIISILQLEKLRHVGSEGLVLGHTASLR